MESFGYIGADGVVAPFATNRAYMSSQFDRKLDGFSTLGGTPDIAARLRDYVARRAALLDGCAWKQIGDHERVDSLEGDLARFA